MRFLVSPNITPYIAASFTPEMLVVGGIALLIALYAAYQLGTYCAERWNSDTETVRLRFMWIMGAVTTASLLIYGCTMTTVQAIFLCGVYLFASYSDIKSRLVADSAHILLLATALIGREPWDIPYMAISAGLIGCVMVPVAAISKGEGLGGADTKLAAASAFLLGYQRGTVGLLIGLILAVIVNSIKQKKSGKKESFPLVPYLAIGFTLAFFIK